MPQPKPRENPNAKVEVACQEGKIYTGVMGAKFQCQGGRYVRVFTTKKGEKMLAPKK